MKLESCLQPRSFELGLESQTRIICTSVTLAELPQSVPEAGGT